jgi:glycine cleavage system aminomethyltransferase T
MMKNTPFTKFHVALGAKMMPFAGYNMPIQYEGVIAEHLTVRKSVGVFDVSHMGEIWVRGPQAFDLLQYITTNDVASFMMERFIFMHAQWEGRNSRRYSVYRITAQSYLLVVNAANIEKDGTGLRNMPWLWGCKLEGMFTMPQTKLPNLPYKSFGSESHAKTNLSIHPRHGYILGNI